MKKQQQSAGHSAFRQGSRRKKAVSESERRLAFLGCVVSVVAMGLIVGWLIAFAAIGVVFMFGTGFVLVSRAFKMPTIKDSWERGSLGERLTARVLARLGSRKYLVIHDVALGSSRANIDHVVVGPTGVFVLDSKHWRGKASQDAEGVWKYGVPVGKTAAATTSEKDWIASFLEPEVSAWHVPVHAAWVMTGTQQPFSAVGDVDVIALDSLLQYVTQRPTRLSRGPGAQIDE